MAKKVNVGTMTSSPGPMSSTARAREMASEPEAQAMAWPEPVNFATSSSRALTSGPRMKQPELSTRLTASSICFSRPMYCVLRSNSGTCMVAIAATLPGPGRYCGDTGYAGCASLSMPTQDAWKASEAAQASERDGAALGPGLFDSRCRFGIKLPRPADENEGVGLSPNARDGPCVPAPKGVPGNAQ